MLVPEGLLVVIGFNPHGLWRNSKLFEEDNRWWNYPLTHSQLLRMSSGCSLVEIYTEYQGFLGNIDCVKNQDNSAIKSFMLGLVKNMMPSSGMIYKSVFRKKERASTLALCDDVDSGYVSL